MIIILIIILTEFFTTTSSNYPCSFLLKLFYCLCFLVIDTVYVLNVYCAFFPISYIMFRVHVIEIVKPFGAYHDIFIYINIRL